MYEGKLQVFEIKTSITLLQDTCLTRVHQLPKFYEHRLCKDLSHVPLKCHEVIKTDKARLLIEEKMTQALLRTCYKCKTQFYKEEGCNKMTCVKCHSIMCYLCDKPVKGYDHFNGQGSANNNL